MIIFFYSSFYSLIFNKESESGTCSESNGTVDKIFEMSEELRKDYGEAQKDDTNTELTFAEEKSNLEQACSDDSTDGARSASLYAKTGM